MTFEPKPRLVGSSTGGPPVSIQWRTMEPTLSDDHSAPTKSWGLKSVCGRRCLVGTPRVLGGDAANVSSFPSRLNEQAMHMLATVEAVVHLTKAGTVIVGDLFVGYGSLPKLRPGPPELALRSSSSAILDRSSAVARNVPFASTSKDFRAALLQRSASSRRRPEQSVTRHGFSFSARRLGSLPRLV
jgi:hypothetical protein